MSLDYGYGDHYERELAERADDDSELSHAVLHGPDSPYTVPPRETPESGTAHDGSGVSECGFCKGQPVGNAAAWVDGGPRRSAECPRCGVRTPYPEEREVA
jgi:hypothetical protein